MEVVLGALPSLLPKLSELLADEYKLHKEMKGGIIFLQEELETMKAALQHISKTPADQLPDQDKIWARNVRELSYDIEDNIDTFMVQAKGHQLAKKKGFKKFIEKTLGSLMQPKIRRKIAIDIRDLKDRVKDVHDRHRRYEVNYTVDKPVKVDPLALVAMVRYKNPTELVGIHESRDEVIKILTEGNEASSKEQKKIVSIVGLGGLGKTTLANAVYEKLRAQFDCSAFISVSQTPDMDRLFKSMLSQLANKNSTASIDVIIDELRGFLQEKRYLVIIDDIWKISNWEMIRCALPDGSAEYRIITTSRNFEVAKEIGGPYKMKSLSLENSRILMYGRIFGKENNDKCPDEQLEEVSKRILKKCDGVPLALITIASLLASKGRNKLDWYDVCNSIGAGLEKNNTIEGMRKVLSLSYNDMPSHIRTCLLYLSTFPEDYDIRKDRLIWLWIAEGFIQHEKQGKGLFEQGENYFNELINRSMIQPTSMYDIHSDGMVECCRVHDMVLDLICSLSSEENFVASKKVRRLSLQTGIASRGTPEATLSKEHHVRSVIIFQSAIGDYIPKIVENFCILRVLDLEGCDLSQGCLKYLVNSLHLRYLCLRDTDIDHLPEEIGNLQFLQTLDVCSRRSIPYLPSSIVRLTQLTCLRINNLTRVPEGIGSLIALEELQHLRIYYKAKLLEELAHLTELKVLDLEIVSSKFFDIWMEQDQGVEKYFVEFLNKLQKIQSLTVTISKRECYLDDWIVSVPQNLRALKVCESHRFGLHGPERTCWFATLPSWLKVKPSLIVSLSVLQIGVKRLPQEDLEILGMLPALRILCLTVDHENLAINGRLVVCACSFPCLERCRLCGFGGPIVFEQGAMPRLEVCHLQGFGGPVVFEQGGRRFGGPVVFEQGAMPRLVDFQFPVLVQPTREINGSFDLGLRNLPSLQRVIFWFQSGGAKMQEVVEAEAAVRHAIMGHPNNIFFQINSFL